MKAFYYCYLLPVPFRSLTIGIVSFFLINGLLTACNPEKHLVAPNIAMTTLPGYTVRDSAISHHDFNVWLVTTETSFDSLFTPVITSAYRPRFDDEIAVAIRVVTDTYSYKVSFKEMVRQGSDLNVYFKIEKERPNQEGAGWVSVTAFPKNKLIRKVNFYYDKDLIKSIPVVIVY